MRILGIVTTLLVALLVGTGIGKIKRATPIVHNLEASDVPRKAFTPLGSLTRCLIAKATSSREKAVNHPGAFLDANVSTI